MYKEMSLQESSSRTPKYWKNSLYNFQINVWMLNLREKCFQNHLTFNKYFREKISPQILQYLVCA